MIFKEIILTVLGTSIDSSLIGTYNIFDIQTFKSFMRDVVTKYIVNSFLVFFTELVSLILIVTF